MLGHRARVLGVFRCLTVTVAMLSSAPLVVQADITPISSPDAFVPAQTIDFDGLSLGWLSNPSAVAGTGLMLGNTTGLAILPGVLYGLEPGNVLWDKDGSIEFQLNTPVDAVGFNFSHIPGAQDIVLSVYGENGLLGSTISSGDSGYLGILAPGQAITSFVAESRALIAGPGQLDLRATYPSFALDNIGLGNARPIPAPGALVLALGGLGCVKLLHRRVR